jgi:hypothetical protein
MVDPRFKQVVTVCAARIKRNTMARETPIQRKEREKTERLRAARLAKEAEDRANRKPEYRPRPHDRLFGMQDEVSFGEKHRGRTIEEVLDTDHEWVRWAIDSIEWFMVTDEVEEELKMLEDPRRPIARER